MLKLIFSLSSLSFIGYAIGFINQIIIASKIGTSVELDIYLFALSIVNFGWFFIGPINEISIPNFFKKSKISNIEGSIYFSKILNIILLLSLIISVLIYLFLPNIFEYTCSGKNINYFKFYENILFLLPIIILTAITQFFQVVLNSMSKYIAQSIGKVITASISVLFLLIYLEHFGIKAIILGTELGLFFLLLLQGYFIYRLGIRYKPLSGIIVNYIFYKHTATLFFTYVLSALQAVYEKSIFMFFGTGVLSSYNYSQALLQVPQMIVVTGVVAIVWTNFMNNIHENKIDKGLDELFNIAFISFTIALLVATTISIFSEEVILIIFSRGKFDMESVKMTKNILSVLIFTLPFLVFNNIIGRSFVALKKVRNLLKIGAFTSVSLMILFFISQKINSLFFAIFSLVLVYFLISIYCILIYKTFYKNKQNVVKKIFFNLSKILFFLFFYAILLLILKKVMCIDLSSDKIYIFVKLLFIGIALIVSLGFLFVCRQRWL